MQTPAQASDETLPPKVQLIIFGDSWCKGDTYLRTWPELLGERLGWSTVNVAIPGSDSRMLNRQCDLLLAVIRRRQLEIHEDAWILVHTGGNDLMSSHPRQLFGFVGAALGRLLCCGLPVDGCCGSVPVVQHVTDNVQALMTRLHATLGIRNAILVGMPLTSSTPMVEHMVRLLLGDGGCVSSLGNHTLRSLNAAHIARLRRLRPELSSHAESEELETDMGVERLQRAADFRVLCLDEAAAIDATVAADVGGRDGEFVALGAFDALWQDPIHPSQRCHEALSEEFLLQFRQALEQPSMAGGTGAKLGRLTRAILTDA